MAFMRHATRKQLRQFLKHLRLKKPLFAGVVFLREAYSLKI